MERYTHAKAFFGSKRIASVQSATALLGSPLIWYDAARLT